tara:strand:+ start:6455 stop:6556 length:102 start_codon:yes stop_codon:yes gene_type:complete
MVAAQDKEWFFLGHRSGLFMGQHFESSWAPSKL